MKAYQNVLYFVLGCLLIGVPFSYVAGKYESLKETNAWRGAASACSMIAEDQSKRLAAVFRKHTDGKRVIK